MSRDYFRAAAHHLGLVLLLTGCAQAPPPFGIRGAQVHLLGLHGVVNHVAQHGERVAFNVEFFDSLGRPTGGNGRVEVSCYVRQWRGLDHKSDWRSPESDPDSTFANYGRQLIELACGR